MKTVIFGGTFDPVHIGHLHLADIVCRKYGNPEIIFLPSGIPPHKDNTDISSSGHRIKMLELALKDTPWTLELSEIKREGITYTIDSVHLLRKKYEWKEPPGFIIGDDLLQGFTSWKEPDLLAEEVRFILASRLYTSSVKFDYPHDNLENSILPVASSEIRRAALAGEAFRFLLVPAVYDYISKNRLYGFRAAD